MAPGANIGVYQYEMPPRQYMKSGDSPSLDMTKAGCYFIIYTSAAGRSDEGTGFNSEMV